MATPESGKALSPRSPSISSPEAHLSVRVACPRRTPTGYDGGMWFLRGDYKF